tara:strand:- start:272 stop:508 length:237 start_codon:yes stop_codon:yes gene_type:complete
LDIALTIENVWRGKKQRKGTDNLVVSVYNLYGRKNPFSIYFSQGSSYRPQVGEPLATSAHQMSLIGSLIPSVTYNFKF